MASRPYASRNCMFRILEETTESEVVKVEDSAVVISGSPVTANRCLKIATRPRGLFKAASWSPCSSPMETDGPVDIFVESKEFSQLLTLPIKNRDLMENSITGKENDPQPVRPKNPCLSPMMLCEEDIKECGDGFKRPNPPLGTCSPVRSKRVKSVKTPWIGSPSGSEEAMSCDEDGSPKRPASTEAMDTGSASRKVGRSQSESAVKNAIEKSSSDPLLVGDYSRRYSLPLVSPGNHSDLKEIDSSTLVDLINGKYTDTINSFTVIDCRYPYEYDGGHIKGSINIYTQSQIQSKFLEMKVPKDCGSFDEERNILIFHCEFSSQRAPDLCRYLREADRKFNESSFPCLYYPEMYIVYGGYKRFFEAYPEHCIPQEYCTMLQKGQEALLKFYKSTTKTQSVSTKPKSVKRFPRFSSATVVKPPKFNNC